MAADGPDAICYRQTHGIEISENVQKQPWFLEINPNGRIPALTDTLDGRKIRVFESGAILQYLAERYDKDHRISYPAGTPEYWEVTSWVSRRALSFFFFFSPHRSDFSFYFFGLGFIVVIVFYPPRNERFSDVRYAYGRVRLTTRCVLRQTAHVADGRTGSHARPGEPLQT